MQAFAVFLSFILTSIYPVMGAINLATFQQEALAQHNYYRQQIHCTTAMTLNSSISTMAQNYAQYLAANNIFNHSRVSGYGENLYYSWSSASIISLNGSEPTNAWYSEIASYNYNSPGFSSSTGHFTQVVWSDSIQLGIGVALTSDNKTAYVVANYYPPGNYANQFAAKVPPVCSVTTTTSSPSTSASSSSSSGSTSTSTPSSSSSSPGSSQSTSSAGTGSTSSTPSTTGTVNSASINWSYYLYNLWAALVIIGLYFH
ncbi:unnamed protein product [Adineta ricciae]|uniref:SCP domain-containing protein n=1 Tax=Adineta ricciae TaxID=249248 RepID=A0A815RWQ0_ADIRI|nr:unnamed protein product [Adineta ricciae]CAF1482940.1 unnamed protein product [Adineta ricciae]